MRKFDFFFFFYLHFLGLTQNMTNLPPDVHKFRLHLQFPEHTRTAVILLTWILIRILFLFTTFDTTLTLAAYQ